MQQYLSLQKDSQQAAKLFAEESLDKMQGSAKWRIYLELGDNAKKSNDFEQVLCSIWSTMHAL
jgi:hypothetical protein